MKKTSGLTRQFLVEANLFVFPFLLIALYCLIRSVMGPYFFPENLDPDYAYFFNSLNLAVSQSPAHIDHPGTTVQLLGALIIKLENHNGPDVIVAANSIARSESLLHRTNLAIFYATFISILAGSLLIFHKAKEKWPVFLFQLSFLFLGGNI